jgi:hypothetical protein
LEHAYARARADHAVCSRLPSPHSAYCARTSSRTIDITTQSLTTCTTIIIATARAHASRASHTIAVPTSVFFLPICIHVCIYAESSLDTFTRNFRVIIACNIDNCPLRGLRTAPHTASDTRLTHTSAPGYASTSVFYRARSRRNVTTLHAWA